MNNIIGVENQMQHQGRRPGGGGGNNNNHPPPPHQRCPRCDSHNTKFCYYNNYSLSQPRYYCKACRRYWTQGGTLRNVPIGGGCRKNKRGAIRVPPQSPPNLGARTQGFPPAVRHPNATAVVPPPPQMGSPFYGGGSFMPPLVQPLSAGQGMASGMNLGAGGPFSGLMHGPAHQLEQPPARFFPRQLPSLISPTGFNPWGQSFLNSGGSTSSSGGGNDQAGPSSASYQWGDGHQGFNP